VLGWDALKAGLAYLPLAVTIMFGAIVGSQLANKVGFKPVLAAGMVFTAIGLLWWTQISVDGSFLSDVLGPSMVAALGLGLSFPGATVGGTAGVRMDEAGLASGLINSAQQVGGALGLAILSAIATSVTGDTITPASLTDGFQAAFAVGAGFAILGAIVALTVIKSSDSRAAISADGPPAIV